MEKKNWFVRYGFHTIVAALISASAIIYIGGVVSSDISRAQFIGTLVPELTSGESNRKKLGYFLIRKYLSEDEAKEVGEILGEDMLSSGGAEDIAKFSVPFQYNSLNTFDVPASVPTSAAALVIASYGTRRVYQGKEVVLIFDKPYDVRQDEFTVNQANIVGSPDYNKSFKYAGKKWKIESIREQIGLLSTPGKVEGPVLRGVLFTEANK